MKKLMTLKLLSVLAITAVFTGCDECKHKVQKFLPQDFKDCHIFPVGSWWVYAVNGVPFDTITLIHQEIIPPDTPTKQNDCETWEEFTCSYESSTFMKINIANQDNIYGNYFVFRVSEWFETEEELSMVTNNDFFFIYWGGGVFGLIDVNEIDVHEQLDLSCGYWLESISDTTFNEVTTELRVFRTFDLNELAEDVQQHIDSLPPYRTYYARGIGLIKKEMYNGDVWTLEDYFINQ